MKANKKFDCGGLVSIESGSPETSGTKAAMRQNRKFAIGRKHPEVLRNAVPGTSKSAVVPRLARAEFDLMPQRANEALRVDRPMSQTRDELSTIEFSPLLRDRPTETACAISSSLWSSYDAPYRPASYDASSRHHGAIELASMRAMGRRPRSRDLPARAGNATIKKAAPKPGSAEWIERRLHAPSSSAG